MSTIPSPQADPRTNPQVDLQTECRPKTGFTPGNKTDTEINTEQVPVLSARRIQSARILHRRGLSKRNVLKEDSHPPLQELRIVVRGLCAVGTEIALALANSGVKRIELADNRPIDFVIENLFTPNHFGLSRQVAVRKVLEARHQNLLLGKISKPDLVIVVGGAIPDLGLVGRLMANELTHLLISVSEQATRIGPLVVPGHTACSVCMEHVLLEQNPNWLQIRPEIEALPTPEISVHLRQATAALTIHMIEQLASSPTSTTHPPTTEFPTIKSPTTGFPITEPPTTESPTTKSPTTEQSTTEPLEPANVSVSWKIFNQGIETETWSPHPKCLCTNRTT